MAGSTPTTNAYYKEVPEAVLDAVAQIYVDCFTGPPRFETWTVEQAKGHIERFVECGADIVVVRNHGDGTIDHGEGTIDHGEGTIDHDDRSSDSDGSTESGGTIVSFGIGLPMKDYFNKDELIEHGATESSYYFAELATKPCARNKGYGSLLHQKRLAIAKERGFHKLNVRVREDNDVIIKMLTEKLGFKQVGRYVGSIKNSQSVRLILELDT